LPQAADRKKRRKKERMTHGQIIFCILPCVISSKTTPQEKITVTNEMLKPNLGGMRQGKEAHAYNEELM
jgi:hypothetical protein